MATKDLETKDLERRVVRKESLVAATEQGDAAAAVADAKGDNKEQEVEGRNKADQEKGTGEKPERIQAAEPQIRVCQVKQLSASEPRSALLESGATRCSRRASSCTS